MEIIPCLEKLVHNSLSVFSYKTVLHHARLYMELTKPRLSWLVVFSSVCGYFMATSTIQWSLLMPLALGGYLITGASNTFNQVIEKHTDLLMIRTQKRPLPEDRISSTEALIFASLSAILGLGLMFFYLTPLSGWLSLLSLLLYVFLYTPLKKITPLSVFVGAFPGAFPPMIGYIAVSGHFGIVPGLLFAVQFMWQFPHFWAIAWKCHDDYEKAGLKMLPLSGGKNAHNAFYLLLYTLFTLPVGYLVYHFNVCGPIYLVLSTLLGLFFSYKAYIFFRHKNDQKALELMFSSFFYLPLIQLSMVFDKINL